LLSERDPSSKPAEFPANGFITSVERQKRNPKRYNIYVNEHFTFSVHEDILIKHRLLKGEEIFLERMKEIVADEEKQKATNHALSYLARKPRSVAQVKEKLKVKGHDTEIIDLVINQLKENNYLNDRDYAHTVAQYYIKQNKGRKWVSQKLSQDGISKEYIQEALADMDEDNEFSTALHIALKRWKSKKEDDDIYSVQRKMAAFLIRKGYSGSVVNKVLKEIRLSEGKDL